MLNSYKSIVLSLLTISICSCSAVIGTLPEPDPIWKAVSSFGPYDQNNCLVRQNGSHDCSTPDQRAKAYLAQYLPSKPQELMLKLEKMDFKCTPSNSSTLSCVYSKSQPPQACATAERVTITAVFPKNSHLLNNISVTASGSADAENVDERGCFPL